MVTSTRLAGIICGPAIRLGWRDGSKVDFDGNMSLIRTSNMSMQLRWVGEDELDRVAMVRTRAYMPADKEAQRMRDVIRQDLRAKPGDFLLAEMDGTPVGTTASHSMFLWMRGARFDCQGVAYVGTDRANRRSGGKKGTGVASQLMHETIRMARQRNQPITALMPFRASFYEHFGYGLVEHRNDWTIPMSILPPPPEAPGGFRYAEPADQPAIADLRQRQVQAGQCNMERTPDGWTWFNTRYAPEGFSIVDAAPDGHLRGWMLLTTESIPGKDILHLGDWSAESPAAFARLICQAGTMRDQYSTLHFQCPTDWPINHLIKESQLPHRPVNHAVASLTQQTRMQIRILDHVAVLSKLILPTTARGKVIVAIAECEGTTSTLSLDFSDGRCEVKPVPGATADVCCADKTWASIVSGDLAGSIALAWGLITAADPAKAALLDVFAAGPKPFCSDAF